MNIEHDNNDIQRDIILPGTCEPHSLCTQCRSEARNLKSCHGDS